MNNTTKTPTYRRVKLTPDLAREWLKRNTRNRRVVQRRVDQLAHAMKRGEWVENGDTFRFAADGRLIDGQKRAMAVIDSGVTIEAIVAENVADEAALTIDTGQARTFGQLITMLGYKDPMQAAATTRAIFLYETGQWQMYGRAEASQTQLLALLEKRQDDIYAALSRARVLHARVRGATKTVTSVAWWIFADIDRGDADRFFDMLTRGTANPGSPIDLLRRYLERMTTVRHLRPSRVVVLAMFIKAWNAWRQGEKMEALHFRPAGGEKFPVPR